MKGLPKVNQGQMNQQQIQQVRNSWQLISKDQVGFGILFYNRLFEVAPELKVYFKTDISLQSEKLTSTLFSIIKLLEGGFAFERDVKYLALRHSNYGAKPEHYELVGDALLWTLKCFLKDKWNENLDASWKNLYKELSTIMIRVQTNYNENKLTA